MKHLNKPAKSALRLVGYCRVSTETQADRGVSLDAQEERLRAYAKAMGIHLAAVVRETASGRLPPERRPILAGVLARIRSGEADGLLVLRLDRASRRLRHAIDLLDESARRSWRFVAVEQHLDTGSAVGRFTASLLASLAALEAETISERTKGGLAQVAREGRARSRWLPYGWRSASGGIEARGDRRRLVPHAGEQKTLRTMLSMRRRGLGPLRIANRLTRAKVPTRSGRPWSLGSVRAIIETAKRLAEVAA
jgi:site-specific DNA recombinase